MCEEGQLTVVFGPPVEVATTDLVVKYVTD
jgi:hypothetical protein